MHVSEPVLCMCAKCERDKARRVHIEKLVRTFVDGDITCALDPDAPKMVSKVKRQDELETLGFIRVGNFFVKYINNEIKHVYKVGEGTSLYTSTTKLDLAEYLRELQLKDRLGEVKTT